MAAWLPGTHAAVCCCCMCCVCMYVCAASDFADVWADGSGCVTRRCVTCVTLYVSLEIGECAELWGPSADSCRSVPALVPAHHCLYTTDPCRLCLLAHDALHVMVLLTVSAWGACLCSAQAGQVSLSVLVSELYCNLPVYRRATALLHVRALAWHGMCALPWHGMRALPWHGMHVCLSSRSRRMLL